MPKVYQDDSSKVPTPVFKESQWSNGRVMARTLQNFCRRVTEKLDSTRNIAVENRDMAIQATAQATRGNFDIEALQSTVRDHTTSIATNSTNISQNASDIAENRVYAFFMGV